MSILPRCLPSLDSRGTGGEVCLPRFPFIGKSLLGGGAFFALGTACAAQSANVPTETSAMSAQEIIDQLLTFIYSLGHLIGQGIVQLVVTILPSMPVPTELIDPIGVLAILTIFLSVATVAKKLVWIVVTVGWVLIVVRLILEIVQHYF